MTIVLKDNDMQKQPPNVLCKKKFFYKFHKKTSVLESLFNKVSGL